MQPSFCLGGQALSGSEGEFVGRLNENGRYGGGNPVEAAAINSGPVGVFDSGLGGLTVVREVFRQLPGVPILYVADTAHVPYGPRPAHEILAFAHGIIDALLEAGATSILAACNMSSAVALPHLHEKYDAPLVGMIQPGVSAALDGRGEGPLGVLATEGTCKSGAYPLAANLQRPDLEVIQSPCPRFVPLVEAGQTHGPEARAAAEEYLQPLLQAGCKTIILGCTHYPWLLPVLRDVAGSGARFVDPAQAAVEELRRRVRFPSRLSAPSHRFAATADPARLETGVRAWLDVETGAELWPLWDPSTAPVAPLALAR
jgi:glutamate racemase